MGRSQAVVLILMAASASAIDNPAIDHLHLSQPLIKKAVAQHSLEDAKLETFPMFYNKADCWKKKQPIAMTQLAAAVFKLNQTLPGAGLKVEDQKGYGSVMKDGFMQVACIKDYMYHHGDIHGANKHEYEIGSRSNVSIVHYSMLVPSEDQEPMSSTVCFNFCRTVPDMLFFGMTAGRECYCEPFFQPMAGDSSKCDAVCEGEPTSMCGGMAKSSIFEMHFCDSTAEDLADAASKASEFIEKVGPLLEDAAADAETLQKSAETAQASFGSAGDTVMSDLMQSAKVFAGDLQHSAEDANKVKESLKVQLDEATGPLEGADFTDPENMKKAEDTMGKIEEILVEFEKATEDSKALHELAKGTEYSKDGELKKVDGEPIKQYHPIMYFVDREYETVPSTCGGETLKKPIAAQSVQDCAAACDAEGIACAGFSYVGVPVLQDPVCFMFSKFKSVAYYTECKSSEFLQKPSFLQLPTQAAHSAIQKGKLVNLGEGIEVDEEITMCYAKFASFTGTTLKPDPSGKCKLCLKTADKFQRCIE